MDCPADIHHPFICCLIYNKGERLGRRCIITVCDFFNLYVLELSHFETVYFVTFLCYVMYIFWSSSVKWCFVMRRLCCLVLHFGATSGEDVLKKYQFYGKSSTAPGHLLASDKWQINMIICTPMTILTQILKIHSGSILWSFYYFPASVLASSAVNKAALIPPPSPTLSMPIFRLKKRHKGRATPHNRGQNPDRYLVIHLPLYRESSDVKWHWCNSIYLCEVGERGEGREGPWRKFLLGMVPT